jgi:hypothetical protein
MAKLAQAYVHLRPFELTQAGLNEIGHATERIATEVAQRVYKVEITIDVDLEAGSFKGRVTAIGLLFGVYGVVADYKGFKESIGEMCKDAREFAYDVCGEVLKLTGASEKQVVKVEKRTMTPGRLSRVIKRLEWLDEAGGTISESQKHQEMQKIVRELELIKRDLSPREVDLLERALEYLDLPPAQQAPSNWPDIQAELPRVAIRQGYEDVKLARGDAQPEPKKLIRYHNTIGVPSTPKTGER